MFDTTTAKREICSFTKEEKGSIGAEYRMRRDGGENPVAICSDLANRYGLERLCRATAHNWSMQYPDPKTGKVYARLRAKYTLVRRKKVCVGEDTISEPQPILPIDVSKEEKRRVGVECNRLKKAGLSEHNIEVVLGYPYTSMRNWFEHDCGFVSGGKGGPGKKKNCVKAGEILTALSKLIEEEKKRIERDNAIRERLCTLIATFD